MEHIVDKTKLKEFQKHLMQEEKSSATIKKYMREVELFSEFLRGKGVNKEIILAYREYLLNQFQAQTVNGKLSAISAYLKFAGWDHLAVKLIKVQRRSFLSEDKELTDVEYRRLLTAAKQQHNLRLYYLMMTVCSTGIRISELKFITLDVLKVGYAEIRLKGKNRRVILPKDLVERLQHYVSQQGVTTGPVFQTRNGRPLDRSNICHDMKRLCEVARVDANKVFPHNLRHLFARSFYAIEKNLAHLADILGHSSIETTRIYIAVSMKSHERVIRKMQLIV